MNENQIDYFLYSNLRHLGDKRFVDFYKGTFSADEVYKNNVADLSKPKCFGFVFNTLERSEANNNIGHWLAVYVQIKPESKRVDLKFVDSYKKPYYSYGKHISRYVDRLRSMALENNFKFDLDNVPHILQAYGSKICGGYTCFGILKLKNCRHVKLDFFFSNFEIKNRKKNDFVMGEYIAKNWPVRSCSHSTTTTTGVPFCPKKIYDHPNCLPKCLCKHESCKTPKSADYIRKLVANIFI